MIQFVKLRRERTQVNTSHSEAWKCQGLLGHEDRRRGNDFLSFWQLDSTLISANRFILGNQHRDGYVHLNSPLSLKKTAGAVSATKTRSLCPDVSEYTRPTHMAHENKDGNKKVKKEKEKKEKQSAVLL